MKWPNDVWIDGRKVAGILVEARGDEWAVLGIGVNVALDPATLPPEVAEIAGHARAATPTRSSRRSRAADALERRLGEDRAAPWPPARPRRAARPPVRWQDGEGDGAGIDDTGALLVSCRRQHDRAERGRVTLRGLTYGVVVDSVNVSVLA